MRGAMGWCHLPSAQAYLKFFAGNEENPRLDVFPAALGPCRILRGAPLTQFEGGGQGPSQSYCGAHTPREPLCLVGIPRALYPRVFI